MSGLSVTGQTFAEVTSKDAQSVSGPFDGILGTTFFLFYYKISNETLMEKLIHEGYNLFRNGLPVDRQ